MKKIFAVILTVCMLLSCAALAEGGAIAGHKIGFIQLTLNSNYHSTMSDHFEEIALAAGADVVMTNGEWAIDAQLQLCEDLIAQGCEAIILNPCGDEVVPVILARCQENNIPLICVDNTVPGADYTYVGIDNFAICRGIGQYLANNYDGGNVVYIRSTPDDTGCPSLRFSGIMAGIADEGEISRFKLIDERYVEDVNAAEGVTRMEEMLAGNDDITIVITHRDGLAIGALTAIANSGRTDIKCITGFDGEKAYMEKMGSGTGIDLVTGLNSPVMIADMTLELLDNYFAGEELPASYYTPVVTVTSANVADYINMGF